MKFKMIEDFKPHFTCDFFTKLGNDGHYYRACRDHKEAIRLLDPQSYRLVNSDAVVPMPYWRYINVNLEK